jgi:GTPase Era involved in 16S rRNA processing
MKLSEFEAVGRTNIFTGEFRLYKNMSELNEYIKEVDVFTAEQMQEYAKECVREAVILNSGGAVSDDMIQRAIDSVFTEDAKND